MKKVKFIIYSFIIFLAVTILLIGSSYLKKYFNNEKINNPIVTSQDDENKLKMDQSDQINTASEESNLQDNIFDLNEDIPANDEVKSNLKNTAEKEAVTETTGDNDDPQGNSTEGISLDVRDIEKSDNETDVITYGIDVAKWQGVIDWAEVKDAGVDFAMIRVGYRTQVNGEINEDVYAKYNLQQAQKHGIKIGAYFFSTAINEKEAKEEAKWVVDFIAPYKITYPVAYNCEGFSDPKNRQYGMSKEERSKLAEVFLDFIKENGYTPMFYGAKSELEESRDWDTSKLTNKYKIWVAQYPASIDSVSQKSSYSGPHDMWQYTSNGKVPGINGSVDLNIAYFGYKKEAEAKKDTSIKEVTADPTALINFNEVDEIVTAKEVTNLRNLPMLTDDSNVVEKLHYGDTARRTGIADNGWSRVEYKGKTLYAVSSYLTTDLNYKDNAKPTKENPEAGITFTEVKDKVTAKIKTNLRLIPSTESDETIVASIENGDIVTRTGIGSNGWSRVEYDGQVLYAVTNYLEIIPEEQID